MGATGFEYQNVPLPGEDNAFHGAVAPPYRWILISPQHAEPFSNAITRSVAI